MHTCHALSASSSQCQKQHSAMQAHIMLAPPVIFCDLIKVPYASMRRWSPGAAQQTCTAPVMPDLVEASRAWKEFAIVFVKADRHHPVGCQEGLLHTIAVVDVDVHIQHPAGS